MINELIKLLENLGKDAGENKAVSLMTDLIMVGITLRVRVS